MAATPAAPYRPPSWFDRKIFNPLVAWLSSLGLSVAGSRILEVRGRNSGDLRRNPVNPLVLDDRRFLVAPRGHTQWVRNLRVAREGHLLLGRKREHFRATELPHDAKEPVLRAYLGRWKWEVGQFFDGVGADSSHDEFVRIAPDHPIFLIEPLPGCD